MSIKHPGLYVRFIIERYGITLEDIEPVMREFEKIDVRQVRNMMRELEFVPVTEDATCKFVAVDKCGEEVAFSLVSVDEYGEEFEKRLKEMYPVLNTTEWALPLFYRDLYYALTLVLHDLDRLIECGVWNKEDCIITNETV